MWISREKIRKYRRWWLFFGVWLPMTLVAVLWFGFPPVAPNQAIRAERDAAGNFIDRLLGDEQESPPVSATFEAQFGKLNAQNNMSSTSSVTSGNPSFFADRHIVLINRSDHTLMKRVGGLVFERLKQQPALQRIDYYPQGESIPQGERAPDIFVTLDLDKIDESGLLIEHALKAKIGVDASDNLGYAHSSYNDHLTPPQIEFDWHGTLKHDSTTTGIGSSAAKYKLAAENIAAQIADALVKQFDGWREKHGRLPAIPDQFYPPYREAAPLPFLEKWNAELQFSGHGLMNHNQSVWTFQSDAAPHDVHHAIAAELVADGWPTPPRDFIEIGQHLRIEHQGAVLEVFPDRESRNDLDIYGKRNEEPQQGPFTYYVLYADRMSQDEVRTACATLLDEEPPVESLVLFNRYSNGDRELEQRILAYLQSRAANSPEALVAMANLLHRFKRNDEAQRVVLSAHALSETLPDPQNYKDRLKRLAETLKMEDFPPKTIDPDLLREHGVRELVPGMRIAEFELGLDEPATFFRQSPDDSTVLYSFRVVPTGNNQFHFAYVISKLGGGSRQWGNGGLVREGEWNSIQKSLNGEQSVRFFAQKLPDVPRVRAAVDVVDPQGPPAKPPYE